MAKTLLNATNEVLTRVGVIAGDSGVLTTLTDSARQPFVDVAVQVINEGLDELYTTAREPKPKEQKEGRIVLVTDVKEYALPDDLVQIRWPLVDRTNNQFITQAAGGYNQMLLDDIEQDDIGLPMVGSISPITGDLFLDRLPTATENGNIYFMQYHRDLVLTAAGAKFPFTDIVFRAMVPVWVQMWKREKRNEFDGDLFKHDLGRASRVLSKIEQREDYSPKSGRGAGFDPFNGR